MGSCSEGVGRFGARALSRFLRGLGEHSSTFTTYLEYFLLLLLREGRITESTREYLPKFDFGLLMRGGLGRYSTELGYVDEHDRRDVTYDRSAVKIDAAIADVRFFGHGCAIISLPSAK